jgi:8-oxo-dGTP pyrophosphatase MutT (NUDIX family)
VSSAISMAAVGQAFGDAWVFPGGRVEPQDGTGWAGILRAAVREVEEETGLVAEIREPLGDISYWYVWNGVRVRKKVSFFLMEAVGGDVANHDHEMEEVRWFPAGRAAHRASYPSERELVERAAEHLTG